MVVMYSPTMYSPQFLQCVLDSLPDAMLVVDESGVILLANQEAGHFFGYGAGELLGQSVELLMPERFRLPHIRHRIRFADYRGTRPMGAGGQLFALCRDGSERPVDISLGCFQQGLQTLIVAGIRYASVRNRSRSESAAARMAVRSPARILIVEDERIVAADVQQTLRTLGYDAYAIAGSREAAMAIAAVEYPDLAVMDIRIDGPIDGIDTAMEMRERFGTRIVFLTAYADDLTLERAKRLMPCGYLLKPVTALAIKAAVELSLAYRANGGAKLAS